MRLGSPPAKLKTKTTPHKPKPAPRLEPVPYSTPTWGVQDQSLASMVLTLPTEEIKTMDVVNPITDTDNSEQTKSWRDVLKVHPAAELFPEMGEAELRELA